MPPNTKTQAFEPTLVEQPSTNGHRPTPRWDTKEFLEKTGNLRELLTNHLVGQNDGLWYVIAGLVLGDVVMLRGPSGVGKTETAELLRQAVLTDVEKQSVTIACYQGMSRARLYGSENPLTGQETRPALHGQAIQITLDEIGQASEEDMTHLHQVIGRREVIREGMDNFELHDNVYFVLTGNTPDYASNVDPTEPMMDRIGVAVPYGYLSETDLDRSDSIRTLEDIRSSTNRWETEDVAAAQLYIESKRDVFDSSIRAAANFLVGHIGNCNLWHPNGRASARAAESIKDYANVLILLNRDSKTPHGRARILVDVVWKTLYHRLRPAQTVMSEDKRQQVFRQWLSEAVAKGSNHPNVDLRAIFGVMVKLLANDNKMA